jgi:hypothetical protein
MRSKPVPYEVIQNHDECPDDSSWGVVKIADGELMGCHATEAEAQDQIAALYAEEEGEMSSSSTAPWRGPLAVEGTVTGDGREFAEGALTWADLPIPLRWNKEDSHGGEPHTVAVNVGRIDHIWRDGNQIMGEGVLNLKSEDGSRVYQMIEDKFLRGVSIDADSISDADVEFVWPEDSSAGEDEEDPLALLFAQPEKIIFHAGRIRAATLVDIPAFAEAYIELTDQEGNVIAGGSRFHFGAVGTHETATSEASWDGPANETRLPSPMSVETARNAYAWIDDARVEDGEIVKDAARFIHHEVSADGSPGAANLTACSSGIGILNGGRGGTTIPEADVQGVYDHLAAHLRDAGREPPPLTASAAHGLTAALTDEDWAPPKSWFDDPKLNVYTGITVHANGRVYGHAAAWGSCHIGYADECVSVPEEDSHPYFMTGEVLTEEGEAVSVGQITVGTGHAGLNLGHQAAAAHYDNTGWAVADVAVGNDAHGIWVAGAVRPNAESAKVHELRASGRVSGDWRRIGGKLRLVGLLAVNVAGFLEPSMRARVASGNVLSLVAAGSSPVAPKLPEMTEQQAMRIVMGMLAERVRKE